MRPIWLSFGLLFLLPVAGIAQPKLSFETAVKKIEARFEPAEAKPGQTVTFTLAIQLYEGWYTYPTVQPNPEIASTVNKIVLPSPGDVIFVEPVQDPAGFHTASDKTLGDKRYYPDRVVWSFPAVASPKATPGTKTVALKQVRVLVCVKQKKPDGEYEEKCLVPKTVPVAAEIKVLEGAAA